MICPICQRNSMFYTRRHSCYECGIEKKENGMAERAFYLGAVARIAASRKESPYHIDRLSTAWYAGYTQSGIDFCGEKPEKKIAQMTLW